MAGFRQIHLTKTQLVVYHTRGHATIGAFSGKSGILISDKRLLQDTALISFRLRGHWQSRSSNEPVFVPFEEDTIMDHLGKLGPLLHLNGKTLALYDGATVPRHWPDKWIITANVSPPPRLIYYPRLVILSTALTHKKALLWQSWCESNSIEYFDVARDGPWITDVSAL